MRLIDTHCHLYLDEFKADIGAVLERAKDAGVTACYLPSIDSTVIDDMLSLEKSYPESCHAMMGLHPCSVKDNFRDELQLVHTWLSRRPFCAVGEIGLDFYWDTTFKTYQYEAFETQLRWALERKLPVVIHTRNALDEAIEVVQPFAQQGLTGIFHCFGGTEAQAEAITGMGFYLGIGGVLTYKNSGLQQVIKNISLDHIVLETDAPYLAPVPYRGKRNESSYLLLVAQKLAEIRQLPLNTIADATTENAQKIFGN